MATDGKTAQAIERLWSEIERREDEIIETVAELVRVCKFDVRTRGGAGWARKVGSISVRIPC